MLEFETGICLNKANKQKKEYGKQYWKNMPQLDKKNMTEYMKYRKINPTMCWKKILKKWVEKRRGWSKSSRHSNEICSIGWYCFLAHYKHPAKRIFFPGMKKNMCKEF